MRCSDADLRSPSDGGLHTFMACLPTRQYGDEACLRKHGQRSASGAIDEVWVGEGVASTKR